MKERSSKKEDKTIENLLAGLEISTSDDAVCPVCGSIYSEDDTNDLWICCDGCNKWFDQKCTKVQDKKNIPDKYFCQNCM